MFCIIFVSKSGSVVKVVIPVIACPKIKIIKETVKKMPYYNFSRIKQLNVIIIVKHESWKGTSSLTTLPHKVSKSNPVACGS